MKKLFAIVTCTILVLIIVGCGKTDNPLVGVWGPTSEALDYLHNELDVSISDNDGIRILDGDKYLLVDLTTDDASLDIQPDHHTGRYSVIGDKVKFFGLSGDSDAEEYIVDGDTLISVRRDTPWYKRVS